jgi:hypothetical protein
MNVDAGRDWGIGYVALIGLGYFYREKPGALPRAVLGRIVGAEDGSMTDDR